MPIRQDPKPCCNEIDLTKLGRCRKCIILSALLSIVSWTAYFVARGQRQPMQGLPALLLALSGLFTVLLLAHGAAFARRRWRETPQPSAAVDFDPQ